LVPAAPLKPTPHVIPESSALMIADSTRISK
jgi:hypothetical protein